MTPDRMEEAEAATRSFISRERLGWLRTLNQYIPPVLRKRYLEVLDELKTAANE